MLYNIDLYQNVSVIRKIPKGKMIYQKGDSSQNMYLILAGQVGLYKNDPNDSDALLHIHEIGDFFGGISLFLGKERSATAVALEELTVIELGPDNVKAFFEKEPEAMMALARKLCSRLDLLSNSNEGCYTKGPGSRREMHQPASQKCTLFPPEHKEYQLTLNQTEHLKYTYERNMKCPICSHTFKTHAIRTSKLITEKIEYGLRIRYKEIEPIYYDVVTCPNCWYSALTEGFDDTLPARKQMLTPLLDKYKAELALDFGLNQGTEEVFAGYYLALACTPICFHDPYFSNAKLWMKLHRMYDDCQDEEMKRYTAQQALKEYQLTFEKQNLPSKQVQQILYMLGDLNYMLGDLSSARTYFLQAKSEKDGNNMIRQYAEDRINDIKNQKAYSI